MDEQYNKDGEIAGITLSKLSEEILAVICKSHKEGKESISSDEISGLLPNKDKGMIKSELKYLHCIGFVYYGIGGDGYALVQVRGQVTC